MNRSPSEDHDIFVVIVGTPGYASTGKPTHEGENPKDTTGEEIHTNGLDDNTRNLSLRLPPPAEEEYSIQSEYSMIPNGNGLLYSLIGYWFIATIIGVFSVLVITDFVPGNWFSLLSAYDGYQATLSAAFLTGTVGVITALRYKWTDRYRMLCIVPIVVHALAWLLWNNGMAATT